MLRGDGHGSALDSGSVFDSQLDAAASGLDERSVLLLGVDVGCGRHGKTIGRKGGCAVLIILADQF